MKAVLDAIRFGCLVVLLPLLTGGLFRGLYAEITQSGYAEAAGLTAAAAAPAGEKIHFLDTGSGDAILLESNGHFALVDAAEDAKNLHIASDKGYEDYLLRYIKKIAGDENGKVHLDFVLGTHSHSDHIGCFDTVLLDPDITADKAYLRRYTAAGKLDYELSWDNQEMYDDMLAACAAKGIPVIADMPKEGFALGDFTVTIKNGEYDPDPANNSGDENDNSMGVLVEAHGKRAFLAGDINNLSGDEIRLAREIGRVDLLKAGHHGYGGSSEMEFVVGLRPQTVVYTNNPGGPSAEVMRRFAFIANSKQYVTGDFGGVLALFAEEEAISLYAIGDYETQNQ
ncbi:MAG: hypothetical protein LBQ33_03310 [Oscillospiraceae bacterium]|jgi:beta-lactamase superfamily II metal-dependent hydrolase|nr:hypothetical protein [Oscillospiraceae bacterium]